MIFALLEGFLLRDARIYSGLHTSSEQIRASAYKLLKNYGGFRNYLHTRPRRSACASPILQRPQNAYLAPKVWS